MMHRQQDNAQLKSVTNPWSQLAKDWPWSFGYTSLGTERRDTNGFPRTAVPSIWQSQNRESSPHSWRTTNRCCVRCPFQALPGRDPTIEKKWSHSRLNFSSDLHLLEKLCPLLPLNWLGSKSSSWVPLGQACVQRDQSIPETCCKSLYLCWMPQTQAVQVRVMTITKWCGSLI